MIRALSLSALLILAALPAGAETATIRSGEHPDHSRIVVEPGQATPWALGRTATGYELRFDRAGIDFDLAGAFALIPKAPLLPGKTYWVSARWLDGTRTLVWTFST